VRELRLASHATVVRRSAAGAKADLIPRASHISRTSARPAAFAKHAARG
jgi:hypothetical protein